MKMSDGDTVASLGIVLPEEENDNETNEKKTEKSTEKSSKKA